MSTLRTDAHRPVNLVTEDYEYETSIDNNAEEGQWFSPAEQAILDTVLATERGTWQCHHCGARLRYAAILRHLPTGEYIAGRETCLDNRFSLATADFHKLRKQAELDRQAQRIRTAVDEFVAANPDLAFLANKTHEHTNDFVGDVARKLRLYGSLSERQVEAVRKAVIRDEERAVKREADAIAHPAAPVVEGKIVITGEVLSTKWQESMYGSTLKMLVRDDRGFKVWGTVPSSLPNTDRGDRVTFSATVERSNNDESFGFFKRPTKATLIEAAQS